MTASEPRLASLPDFVDMPRRAAASPAEPETPVDRLQATVEELSQNVRVLTDVVDQVREDLRWLTRNGLPHQPLHVLVHRMPLEPSATGGGSVELEFAALPPRDPTADLSDEQQRAAVIDELVERLAEPLGELAQEQLNALLSVMDEAHREVMETIRGAKPPPKFELPDEPKGPDSQLRLF
jgi:uncharacterized coiled-coil protein SlyX